jgi:hypothetical protein
MWLAISENYEVSVEGQVRNKKFNRLLKSYLCGDYLGLRMGNSKSKKFYIHRLVAEAFLPSPTDDCVVDHIDRNRMNNHASNLRWVSRSVNGINRTLEGKARKSNKQGEHHIKRVMTNRQITPSFAVVFDCADFKHYSLHKSIEDAIKSRDSIIKQYAVSPSKSPS